MLEYRLEMQHHNQRIFQLNTLPHLVYVREFKQATESLYKLHTHHQYLEILLIEDGCSTLEIDKDEYRVKPGDIIIINPQTPHRLVNSQSNSFKALLLGINNLHLQDLEPNFLLKKDLHPVVNCYKHISELPTYFKLCKEIAAQAEIDELLKFKPQNYLISSLIILLYNLTSNNQPKLKEETCLGLQIKEYLDNHYLENLNLKTIAANLHINQYYMAHSFKNYMGLSPIQYMIKKRINEAQNLLLTSNLTVTEIAFHCGYNNSNYFQTVFNNNVGMPPGKYREMWKK